MNLVFVGKSGGSQLGCLNMKLSNGVTTQNKVVPWITGLVTIGLAIIMAISGVAGGANAAGNGGTRASVPGAGNSAAGNAGGDAGAPHAPGVATTPAGHPGPPAGHLDPITLFLHFQSISSTGLLSLSYPLVYQGFTTNFAWANFLIPIHAFRRAAGHMRKCNTNGNTRIPAVSPSVSAGMATYSSHLGINPQDIFGIVYLVFLCACLLLLGLHMVAKAAVHIAVRRAKDWAKCDSRRAQFAHMSSNNTLRLVRDH